MQWLAKRIAKGDWEKHKRDKYLEPYQHVKQELSVAEGLIFRERRIVLPPALGHGLGHLEKTYNVDQANAERKILVSTDEQYDRYSYWPVLRVPSSH